MELLLLLVEQRGQLVTREQMVERSGVRSLLDYRQRNQCCNSKDSAKVLDDCADQPRFIQTVIGRGYRFCSRSPRGPPLRPSSLRPWGESPEKFFR